MSAKVSSLIEAQRWAAPDVKALHTALKKAKKERSGARRHATFVENRAWQLVDVLEDYALPRLHTSTKSIVMDAIADLKSVLPRRAGLDC